MLPKLDCWWVGLIASVLLTALPLHASEDPPMSLKRLTTVIYTDEVDACAAFWTERVGLRLTMAVPAQQPGATGNQFVAVADGQIELMIQDFASVEAEQPGLIGPAGPRSYSLFVEVADLEAMIRHMEGLEPVVARHATFYGADEISYRAPCGSVVTFAEFNQAVAE
jgi:catechol 2,3-dioxygenase-like lactoylglutathione lyase family enzyme